MSSLALESASLVRAAGRELVWGLAGASREMGRWRERAVAIPDPLLRTDALQALERKRGNVHGAALFWTLPRRRSRDLLKALVAYEVLADYLDCVSERGAALGAQNGQQLHLALREALDPRAETSDYYRHHHSARDGGYACALVQSCRAGAQRLPSYERMRPLLADAASMSTVLALNHEPDPARREQGLREWIAQRWPDSRDAAQARADAGERSWFERAAGASAWLTVLALLALAAEPERGWHARRDAMRTYVTYLQWIAPLGAMLDSLGDIGEDTARGQHSYIAHYPSMATAVERVGELVRRSLQEARALPDGARHAALTACMIAFYLSKDSVRTPELRASTQQLVRAGGPMVALLLPVLRLWRTAYGQRSA
jgi:tetraprenyl-beta-curcumene synthase